MAILILRPNAVGDETAITAQQPGDGAHWDKVDEAEPDYSTTYVCTDSTDYLRDLYNLPASGFSEGVINSIRIYFNVSPGNGTGYFKPSQKSGATVTDGTEVSHVGGWTAFSQLWATNPATAAAWTWANIDALQIGIAIKGDGVTSIVAVTQLYVEIDYRVAGIIMID